MSIHSPLNPLPKEKEKIRRPGPNRRLLGR